MMHRYNFRSSLPTLALALLVVFSPRHKHDISAHESCCKHKLKLQLHGQDNKFIADPDDLPPEEFEGQRRMIPNPASYRPDYWDDEDDGLWEPELIENPDFLWRSTKMISNPNYTPPSSYWDKIKRELQGAIPWVTLGVILTAALAITALPLKYARKHLSFEQKQLANDDENRSLALFTSCTKAALLGIATPLCSCGALPLVADSVRRGAPLSSALAFLTASQSAGLDSASITWGLLGPLAALCRLAGAVVLGVATGMIVASPYEKDTEISSKEDISASFSSSNNCVNDNYSAATTTGNTVIKALMTLVDTALEIFPTVFIGLAISTAALHYFPSLENSYDYLHDQATSFGVSGPLVVRLGVLVLALPLQLCEHSTVTLAAGIQKAGGSPGLAFAFLLSAPATNLPSLLFLMQNKQNKSRHKQLENIYDNSSGFSKYVLVQVSLALSGTALLLSYLVDALGVDLLVEKEADAQNTFSGASSIVFLPHWFVKLSPYIFGLLTAIGIVKHFFSKKQDHSGGCCECPKAKKKVNELFW